jgi:hypothetical protein
MAPEGGWRVCATSQPVKASKALAVVEDAGYYYCLRSPLGMGLDGEQRKFFSLFAGFGIGAVGRSPFVDSGLAALLDWGRVDASFRTGRWR